MKKRKTISALIYILNIIFLIAIAFVFKKTFEFVVFVICFYPITRMFDKQFHADSITNSAIKAIRYCSIITFIVQFIYIFILIKFSITFYLNVLLSLTLCILSNLLQDYLDLLKIRKNQAKFNFYHCTLVELKQICKSAKISKLSMHKLRLKYIDNYTYAEIADELNIEVSSLSKDLHVARNKIECYIKTLN